MNKRVRTRESKFLCSALYALCVLLLGLVLAVSGTQAAAVKGNLADACFKCHPKLKEGLLQKNVHFPFKQGKCSACHNPHVSNAKGLIKEEVNSLCLSCHEDIRNLLKKANVHTALKRGVCTDCHYAHSGGNRHLLVKPEKLLCLSCHEPLKAQLNRANVHAPFKEGECSSCHNPHGSSEKNHLLAAPGKTCKSCHAPRCKAGGVSISFATKDLDCASCHTGHSSNSKGLLGPYGHTSFLNKNCEQCHNPIVANRKITIRLEGEKLCFSCHTKDPAKFKENDIHGSAAKGGCGMCHSYHASKKKDITTAESTACLACHEATGKRITFMEKKLKVLKCAPIKDRKCFECHTPLHSSRQYYLKADKILTCAKCHEAQHRITHPIGEGTLDVRSGQQLTCLSCHSLHNANAGFMLTHDSRRQLCIQCHER